MNYVPNYDVTDWRVGFEIEMLFGDLGLKRYRRVAEEDGGYDIAPVRFCDDIAKRLSAVTGEKWTGSEKPDGKGFFVVPEYDLDPLDFSEGTVGGVELITPPLPMQEAEELRLNIIDAVQQLKHGYTPHLLENQAGWHVNVDRGPHDQEMDPGKICAGLWEGEHSEIEILLASGRYGNGGRYTAPQHHAYGPALLLAMHASPFPMSADDIYAFLHHHCGRSKRFATNFGKLESDYLELRHLGLTEFMNEDWGVEQQLRPIFEAMTIGFSNSGEYFERTFSRFKLLGEWLDPLQSRFSIQTGDLQLGNGQEGRLLFDGHQIARTTWRGVAELRFGTDENDLESLKEYGSIANVVPEHTTGLDADELLAGLAVLSMDTLHFARCNVTCNDMHLAFRDQLEKLYGMFDSEGMMGSNLVSSARGSKMK